MKSVKNPFILEQSMANVVVISVVRSELEDLFEMGILGQMLLLIKAT